MAAMATRWPVGGREMLWGGCNGPKVSVGSLEESMG